MKSDFKAVDEYIERFPTAVQAVLRRIREVVHEMVPDSVETISYGMPAFELGGKRLLYFAAHRKHLGIYPAPAAATADPALSAYKTGKATIRIPVDCAADDLVRRFVMLRLNELGGEHARNETEDRTQPVV